MRDSDTQNRSAVELDNHEDDLPLTAVSNPEYAIDRDAKLVHQAGTVVSESHDAAF